MPGAILDAILPAGGRLKPDFAELVGTDVKALIKIGGKPLVESVIDAIEGTPAVRNAVLVGSDEVRQAYAGRVEFTLEEAATGPDNMFNGLRCLMSQPDPSERVLLCTTDLPFIQPEHIDRFIAMCPADKDICVPLVHREDFERAYPGSGSTFVKLREGEYTLGGMFLMTASGMDRMRPHIEAVFAQRKNKLGLAKLLGLPFVLRFLTRTLSLAMVEAEIVSLLDCTGVAIPGAPVELAYDIDDAEDYSFGVRFAGKT